MKIRHILKRCNGNMNFDLSGLISLKCASVAVTPEGIKFGVMEISSKPSASDGILKLCCDRCSTSVPVDSYQNYEISCQVCNEYYPVNRIFVSRLFSCICADCKDAVEGTKPPQGDKARKLLEYYVPKSQNMSFVPLLSVLTSEILL